MASRCVAEARRPLRSLSKIFNSVDLDGVLFQLSQGAWDAEPYGNFRVNLQERLVPVKSQDIGNRLDYGGGSSRRIALHERAALEQTHPCPVHAVRCSTFMLIFALCFLPVQVRSANREIPIPALGLLERRHWTTANFVNFNC